MAGGQPFSTPGDTILGDSPDDTHVVIGNTTHKGNVNVDGELTQNGEPIGGNSEIQLNPYPNSHYNTASDSNNGGVSIAYGDITIFPFIFPFNYTSSRIGLRTTIAPAASTRLKVGVYENGANNLPGNLLIETPELNPLGAVTTMLGTAIYPFLRGVQYWFAVIAGPGGADVATVLGSSGFINLGGIVTTSSGNSHLYASAVRGASNYVLPADGSGIITPGLPVEELAPVIIIKGS